MLAQIPILVGIYDLRPTTDGTMLDESNHAEILIHDDAPYHVHSPGQPFSIQVTPSTDVRCLSRQ